MSEIKIEKHKSKKSKSMIVKRDYHIIEMRVIMKINRQRYAYNLDVQINESLYNQSQNGIISATKVMLYALGRMMVRLLAKDDDRYDMEIATDRGLTCPTYDLTHHSLRPNIQPLNPSPTLSKNQGDNPDE